MVLLSPGIDRTEPWPLVVWLLIVVLSLWLIVYLLSSCRHISHHSFYRFTTLLFETYLTILIINLFKLFAESINCCCSCQWPSMALTHTPGHGQCLIFVLCCTQLQSIWVMSIQWILYSTMSLDIDVHDSETLDNNRKLSTLSLSFFVKWNVTFNNFFPSMTLILFLPSWNQPIISWEWWKVTIYKLL